MLWYFAVSGCALLSAVLALALLREVRWRQALEDLLRRLLAHWRAARAPEAPPSGPHADRPRADRDGFSRDTANRDSVVNLLASEWSVQ